MAFFGSSNLFPRSGVNDYEASSSNSAIQGTSKNHKMKNIMKQEQDPIAARPDSNNQKMNIIKQEQEPIAAEEAAAAVTTAPNYLDVGSTVPAATSIAPLVEPPSHAVQSNQTNDEQSLLGPDGITHSLPYTKYGPYFCPRCLGRFETSQKFAAHMGSHYRHETKEETSFRHALKYPNRDQGQHNNDNGLGFVQIARGNVNQLSIAAAASSSVASSSAAASAAAPSALPNRFVGLTLHQITAFTRRSAAPTPNSPTLNAIQVKEEEVQVKEERMWDY